jgi:hypothetical protein
MRHKEIGKAMLAYFVGMLLTVIVMSFMNSLEITNKNILIHESLLGIGFFLGLYGNKLFSERPWLSLLLPIILLIVGFFGFS